jgi:hypothetical protein
MIGNMLELPKDEDTPQKRVEKIFANMDLVKDAERDLGLRGIRGINEIWNEGYRGINELWD